MKYRPTILNIAAGVFLIGCIIKTIIDYPILSKGEGWGVVGMVGLAGFGVAALVLDFLIQLFFRRKRKNDDEKIY